MSEVQKLVDRLCNNPEKKLVNFHVSWGPEAYKLTPEERAKVLNKALDEAETKREKWTDEPPRTGRKQVDVREWLKEQGLSK